MAHADFRKVGHLSPFSQFFTLRVEIFPCFFVHVCLWPLCTMKSFMKIGLHVFEKSGTHTHTDRRGNFIYIERNRSCTKHQIIRFTLTATSLAPRRPRYTSPYLPWLMSWSILRPSRSGPVERPAAETESQPARNAAEESVPASSVVSGSEWRLIRYRRTAVKTTMMRTATTTTETSAVAIARRS